MVRNISRISICCFDQQLGWTIVALVFVVFGHHGDVTASFSSSSVVDGDVAASFSSSSVVTSTSLPCFRHLRLSRRRRCLVFVIFGCDSNDIWNICECNPFVYLLVYANDRKLAPDDRCSTIIVFFKCNYTIGCYNCRRFYV